MDLDPDELAAGAELVLRCEDSGEERRAGFERYDLDPGAAQAFVDIYDLVPDTDGDTVWVLSIALGGGAPQPLQARKGVGGRDPRVAGDPRGLYRMRARVTDEGVPVVRCKRLPAHAEVERVDVADDSITVTGTMPPREAETTLVAASRRDKTELTWPIAREGHSFTATIATPALVRPGEPDVWDLRLLAGEERLRLGGHFDGILDKRAVIRYPARALVEGDAARRLRPYYTRENRLSVRSTPISVEEAQRKPPPARERPEGPSRRTHENPGLRRRLELAGMGALQKTASLFLRLAIGRRKRRGAGARPEEGPHPPDERLRDGRHDPHHPEPRRGAQADARGGADQRHPPARAAAVRVSHGHRGQHDRRPPRSGARRRIHSAWAPGC